jgi:uncharacterized LabA/DUF88 family protein
MIAGRRPASSAREEPEAKPASRASSGRGRATSEDEGAKPQVRRRRAAPARTRGESEAKPEPAKSESSKAESSKPESTRSESKSSAPAADVAPPAAPAAPETDEVEAPRAPSRRRSAAAPAGEDVDALRGALAQQEEMLTQLRQDIAALGERITTSGYRPRVAIFVDVPNIIYGYEGDGSLNMGNLLRLITEGRDLVRATAYSPVSDDPREPVEQQRFVAPFVPHEYRIVTKPLKRFSDGSIKGNFDVEMAVDMVMMADRVDIISIVSGDADFARAVEVVQQKGVRVEVVAFAGSTSIEMRALADRYVELDRVVKQIL